MKLNFFSYFALPWTLDAIRVELPQLGEQARIGLVPDDGQRLLRVLLLAGHPDGVGILKVQRRQVQHAVEAHHHAQKGQPVQEDLFLRKPNQHDTKSSYNLRKTCIKQQYCTCPWRHRGAPPDTAARSSWPRTWARCCGLGCQAVAGWRTDRPRWEQHLDIEKYYINLVTQYLLACTSNYQIHGENSVFSTPQVGNLRSS